MENRDICFHIRVSRRMLTWSLASLLMCCGANEVVSESLTMTTYYPAPSGTYQRLTTTGNAILARDGGRVGIGTAAPQGALDIQSTTGGFLPPRVTTAQRDAIPAPATGSMIYNTTSDQLQVWSGGWKTVGGALPSSYDPGNSLSVTAGDWQSVWSNLKNLGPNRACVAFMSQHFHHSGGSGGRYEDNACVYDGASGWLKGYAFSGQTYCGYVCFN